MAYPTHGAGLSYFGLVFEIYKALRALGLSVDILAPIREILMAIKLYWPRV